MVPLHTFFPILNPVLSTSIHSLFESAEPTVSRVIRVINSIVLVYTFPICPLPPTLPLCYNVVPLPHRRVPFVYQSQFQPQFQRELDVCLDPFPRVGRVCCTLPSGGGDEPQPTGSCVRPLARARARRALPPPQQIAALHMEPNQRKGRQRRRGRQAECLPHTHTRTHVHTLGVLPQSINPLPLTPLTIYHALLYTRCSRSGQPFLIIQSSPPPPPQVLRSSFSHSLSQSPAYIRTHKHKLACNTNYRTAWMAALSSPLDQSKALSSLIISPPPGPSWLVSYCRYIFSFLLFVLYKPKG